jgi:hypothetical protein
MADPSGIRAVQKFPKTLDRSFVEAKAAAAREDGAASADIVDDGSNYVLTIDWPPLDGQPPPAAAVPGSGTNEVAKAVTAGVPSPAAQGVMAFGSLVGGPFSADPNVPFNKADFRTFRSYRTNNPGARPVMTARATKLPSIAPLNTASPLGTIYSAPSVAMRRPGSSSSATWHNTMRAPPRRNLRSTITSPAGAGFPVEH